MLKYSKPAAILRAAIALIEDRKNWCRFYETADSQGFSCGPLAASRWCARGAIKRCAATPAHAQRVINMFEVNGGEPLACTNDFGSHRMVLRRMRKKLAKLEWRSAERKLRSILFGQNVADGFVRLAP